MKPDDKLVCELCSGERFEELYLPDASGLRRVPTGLLVCRLVYSPPPARPRPTPSGRPAPPDLPKGRPGS